MRREQCYERGHVIQEAADHRRQTQFRASAATGADVAQPVRTLVVLYK